jgi:AcrR family transcriptional regulator
MAPAPGKASASATARERARASLTADIKAEARRQLAEVGADGLSLRAVARELGMVSSALYRYFPSKEELLTALIIDAYNAVGEVAEDAVGASADDEGPREAWIAVCRAIRKWALANPHEYALIYGSPVPGYRAPEATIGPASRVPLALIALLGQGEAEPGAGAQPEVPFGDLGEVLGGQAASLTALLGDTVQPAALVRGVIAWTQLFGMISFELFGQFANTFDPTDALFEFTVVQMTRIVGL